MGNETFIFTFGIGQALAGRYVELKGTSSETREEMVRLFGDKWSMQYPQEAGMKVVDEWNYEQLAVESELSTLTWWQQ